MKYLKQFILLLMITLLFVGCKLGSESNYTPSITLLNRAFLNADSTFNLKLGDAGNVVIDSLHVNDTVLVYVFAQSYANHLTRFDILTDKDAGIELLVTDSIKKYFDESSDFANGKIKFLDETVSMNYPLHFVTKKESDKVKVSMIVESDAKEVGNKNSVVLQFPVFAD